MGCSQSANNSDAHQSLKGSSSPCDKYVFHNNHTHHHEHTAAVADSSKRAGTTDSASVVSASSGSPSERIEIEDIGEEHHFHRFRVNTIGFNATLHSHHADEEIPCIYSDWTASGRCYGPIEEVISRQIAPYVANTHTETSLLGHVMTAAYKRARNNIKRHVHANENDALIVCGSGMTGALNKFQSILGLKVHESLRSRILQELTEKVADSLHDDLPVVFITHYEHHSNQISWENALTEVVLVSPDKDGRVSVNNFEEAFLKYETRKYKYASISACSNVTGVITPFHAIAKVAHKHSVYCFVDFAASFGYVNVDMHPNDDPEAYLDAIFCSPHKLLGGPGSCGVCIFNKALYTLKKPDFCGGGTVNWTNPWGEQGYVSNIEDREDAGTPPFMQTIRAALAIQLKEEMSVEKIAAREHYINNMVFERLGHVENIHILAGHIKERISIFSIYIDGLHYNLLAKLLNDYYGIQCRGGCNCAGTYGHVLFGIDRGQSKAITDLIDKGDNSTKPGWCRLSFHPIMTNAEVNFVCDSVLHIANNHKELSKEYYYDARLNQFYFTCRCHQSDKGKMVTANEQEQWIQRIVDQVLYHI